MFRRTEEKSWLEEEIERERRPWDETWWEKLCRFVRDIFGKCVREAEKTESAYSYDELIAVPAFEWLDTPKIAALNKDAHGALHRNGCITTNEMRAMMGLPPVVYDEDVVFYADNQTVERQNRLNEALIAAKYGISAEEMSSRINQCIL